MSDFGRSAREVQERGDPLGTAGAPGLATGPAGSAVPAAAEDPTRAVYVISVAAELAGVHPQTLRIYERKGLLDPSRTRGGSRRFSERDLARLRRIQQLTTAGLNLEGVRRVLELEAEVLRLQAELERTRVEARRAVEQTHRLYRRDLVPLSNAPVPFSDFRRTRRGG
jgi:MerR family transcriptional regulator/heat shock protein HspR